MKYDFKNPEHFKALEKQAYNGNIDITGFPPAAYRYFDSLRLLYARYKYDGLNHEEAQAQKRRLLRQYNEAVSAYECWRAAHICYQDNIRKSGTLIARIEKSRDIREIALTACECVGRMTNDAEFLKRQSRKFEEEENNDCQGISESGI